MKLFLILIPLLMVSACTTSTYYDHPRHSTSIYSDDYVDYYYYPDVEVYFHILTGYYFYHDHGHWIRTKRLPTHIHLHHHRRHHLKYRGDKPYLDHDKHRHDHPSYSRPSDRYGDRHRDRDRDRVDYPRDKDDYRDLGRHKSTMALPNSGRDQVRNQKRTHEPTVDQYVNRPKQQADHQRWQKRSDDGSRGKNQKAEDHYENAHDQQQKNTIMERFRSFWRRNDER